MPNAKANDPVSAIFGADRPVTYEVIASQVKAMKPSALTPSQFDDVVVLIEYMRDEAVKAHDANDLAAKSLAEREAAVTKREREVAIRGRVIEAAIKVRGPRKWFGR